MMESVQQQADRALGQIQDMLFSLPTGCRGKVQLEFQYPNVPDTILPCIILKGDRPTPVFWVQAAIHGDEYDGAIAGLRLADEIDRNRLCGSVIICPIINPSAFYAYQHGSPYDGNINLNRVFYENGNHGYSWDYGRFLFHILARVCDFFVDCHGGSQWNDISRYAMIPEVGNEVDGVVRELAQRCGLEYIFCDKNIQHGNTGRLIVALAQEKIPGILIENGGGISWTEECVQRHMYTILQLMRESGFLLDRPRAPRSGLFFVPEKYVYFEKKGLLVWHIPLNSRVNRGDVCLRVWEPETDQISEIFCPTDRCFVYCIRTAAVVNRGDFAMAYARYPDGR